MKILHINVRGFEALTIHDSARMSFTPDCDCVPIDDFARTSSISNEIEAEELQGCGNGAQCDNAEFMLIRLHMNILVLDRVRS